MLTKEQQKAIRHIDGPMLVVAGPGSGKTRVLTERVKHLLSYTSPERILVITFTRKAAGEMRERFNRMTDEETAKKVFFGTFHSLYYRLLNEWLGKGWSDEASALSLCQGDEVIYERIMERMREEVVNHRVYEAYDYFLIDEFQDIDPIQYEIVRYMVCPPGGEASANLFAVGDEDQSIYAFRGSDPSVFLRFPSDFPGCQVVTLSTNIRSERRIIELSERSIAHNQNRYSKTIHPREKAGKGKVTFLESFDERMESRKIAHHVVRMHLLGKSYSDIAILCRNGSQLRRIAADLREGGVPYRTKPEWNALGSDHVNVKSELISILRYAHMKNDTDMEKIIPLFDIYTEYGNPKTHLDRERPLETMILSSEAPVEVKEEARLMEQVFLTLAGIRKRKEAYGRILWDTDYLSGALRRLKQHGWGAGALFRQLYKLFYTPTKGVSLMTIHAAKGLEFDTVIVAGLVEGVLPHPGVDIEEERRLFYVAITRAQKQLVLSTYRGFSKAYSRFLRELQEDPD